MSLLNRYLKKLDVKSFLDLNEEERKTFKEWEEALNGRRLTDEDVADFFANEIEDTIAKLPAQRLGSKDDTFLKVKLEFLRNARRFLDRPRLEKEAAEAGLERMLDSMP